MTKTVLLTRPMEDSRKLAGEVEDLGCKVLVAPMLDIRAVETALPDLAPYDALVFTSRHAVRVFARLSSVRDVRAYAVGRATAQELYETGFRNFVSAGGTVADLLDIILQNDCDKILYLRGDTVSFPLSETLRASGVEAEDCFLYAADQAGSIPADVLRGLDDGGIDYSLFYSRRTAKTFVDLVKQSGRTEKLRTIKALCLSNGVLQSASVALWNRTFVSAKPDRLAMMALLRKCMGE